MLHIEKVNKATDSGLLSNNFTQEEDLRVQVLVWTDACIFSQCLLLILSRCSSFLSGSNNRHVGLIGDYTLSSDVSMCIYITSPEYVSIIKDCRPVQGISQPLAYSDNQNRLQTPSRLLYLRACGLCVVFNVFFGLSDPSPSVGLSYVVNPTPTYCLLYLIRSLQGTEG